MITLDGTIQRRLFFPADTQTTLLYFSDLGRVIYFLPHISVVETFDDDSIRIRFQTVELGAYTINVFCDLTCETLPEELSIKVGPPQGTIPVKSESTLNSCRAHGLFTSEAFLFAEDDGTGIDFRFRFRAELPRPRGLRMVPKRVVDRIADSISQGRLEEMVEGFMAGAMKSFPDWYENNGAQIAEARR